MSPLKIGVLVSGTGRLLFNLIQLSKKTQSFTIEHVGADRDCPALKYAYQNNLYVHMSPAIGSQICAPDHSPKVDLICLAGFVGKVQITPMWKNRVMNIHPSLLPLFGGKGMYGHKVHESVYESQMQCSGCTVHFCDNIYDHGPILLQDILTIHPDWTPGTISSEVFELEKRAYPIAIEAFRQCYGEEIDPELVRRKACELLKQAKNESK